LLGDLLRRYWSVLRDPRLENLPRLIMAEAGNFPELASFYYDNVVMRARALFSGVLERGMASGVFRPCDPVLMCRLAVATLMFDCSWRRLFEQCDPQQIAPDVFFEAHLAMFLQNIVVRADR